MDVRLQVRPWARPATSSGRPAHVAQEPAADPQDGRDPVVIQPPLRECLPAQPGQAATRPDPWEEVQRQMSCPSEYGPPIESLREQARDVQHPITARLAYTLLEGSSNKFSWEGRKQLLGGIVLATRQLIHARDYVHTMPEPAKLEITESLAELRESLPGGPIPQPVLESVLHLSTALREKAPELAAACREELVRWHQEGRFQVEQDGRAADLPAALPEGVQVESARVLLPRARADARLDQARELLREIPTPEYLSEKPEAAPGLDRLEAILKATPEKGPELVGALLDESHYVTDRKGHVRVVQVLRRALESPELRQALRPHLDRLSDYTREAAETHQIHRGWARDQWQAAHYDFLLQAFPELKTPELVKSQLVPQVAAAMLRSPNGPEKLMERLWQASPELVAPSVEGLLELPPSRPLGEVSLHFLETAFTRPGHRPDDRELEALAARLYQPQLRDESFYNWAGPGAKEFLSMLAVLSALDRAEPGRLQALRLPDEQGRPVDLKTYALRRILNDPDFVAPEKVAVRLFEGTDAFVKNLYEFIDPAAHRQAVLDEVREGLEHPLSDMRVKQQVTTGLGFLAHLARTDEGLRDELVELLRDKPSIYFTGLSRVVGPLRFLNNLRDLEQGKTGEVTPDRYADWMLSQPTESVTWKPEEEEALKQRVGEAWRTAQRGHYGSSWESRAADLGLPPRLAIRALHHCQELEDPARSFERLESILAHLALRADLADPRLLLDTALQMLAADETYLSPAGRGGVELCEGRVIVGGVSLRGRSRTSA